MVRMLRRRIRKTETAWRKLCRFLCFSAPIHWGTRVASAIRPVRAAVFSAPAERGARTASACSPLTGGSFSLNLSGELRSAERGRLRRPPQGAKRKGHLRFPFLFELLPFPYFLVWRRLPTCDRSEKRERQSSYSCVCFAKYSQFTDSVLLHRRVNQRRVRHNRAAQFVSALL